MIFGSFDDPQKENTVFTEYKPLTTAHNRPQPLTTAHNRSYTMAPSALKIAHENIPKGAIADLFLKDLVQREYVDPDLLKKIKGDEELSHYFQVVSKTKKARKKTSSDTERNNEKYDEHRCSARIWRHEGGLGFDNIQCNSKNMVSSEDVCKIIKEYDMDEEKASSLQEYVSNYGGCFCKKHLSMDFFMPKGYWLGKVNEPRPEEPMLPLGSVKKGYTDEYKPHNWLYDSEGNKVEKKRKSPKSSQPKSDDKELEEFRKWKSQQAKAKEEVKPVEVDQAKAKEESEAKAKEEAEAKANEEAEAKAKKKTAAKKAAAKKKEEEERAQFEAWKASQNAACEDEDSEGESCDESEEEKEDEIYTVDGIKYMKHWDEDEEKWLIIEPAEYEPYGTPDKSGGINFKDESYKLRHEKAVDESS